MSKKVTETTMNIKSSKYKEISRYLILVAAFLMMFSLVLSFMTALRDIKIIVHKYEQLGIEDLPPIIALLIIINIFINNIKIFNEYMNNCIIIKYKKTILFRRIWVLSGKSDREMVY